MKKLGRCEVLEIIEDPIHVLVVESLSGDYFIATVGFECRLIEPVKIDPITAEWLNDCIEREDLYYGRYQSTEHDFKLPAPYYYDIWWDSYGEGQSLQAKREAFKVRALQFKKAHCLNSERP